MHTANLLLNRLYWIYLAAIDRYVCTQLFCQLQFFLVNIDSYYVVAHRLGILQCYVTQATDSINGYPFAWLYIRNLQCFVGCYQIQGQR